MDLLNSILNSMDAPPSTNEQQKKIIKRQREMAEKMKNKQKEELRRFRKYVEERMERFSKDERTHIEFQPLDKVHRSVIHEIAEYGGFIAMSFGREDDRYTVVYKKENAPSEDEITARRNGDGWNSEVAKEYADMRLEKQREVEEEQKRLASASNAQSEHKNQNSEQDQTSTTTSANSDKTRIKPIVNYKDKYAHLIGQEAALEAARKTETNKSYGFVPSKNKKDIRSIEQTLADIQAKKRRRLEEQKQEQEHQQQQQQQQQEQEQHLQQLQYEDTIPPPSVSYSGYTVAAADSVIATAMNPPSIEDSVAITSMQQQPQQQQQQQLSNEVLLLSSSNQYSHDETQQQ